MSVCVSNTWHMLTKLGIVLRNIHFGAHEMGVGGMVFHILLLILNFWVMMGLSGMGIV